MATHPTSQGQKSATEARCCFLSARFVVFRSARQSRCRESTWAGGSVMVTGRILACSMFRVALSPSPSSPWASCRHLASIICSMPRDPQLDSCARRASPRARSPVHPIRDSVLALFRRPGFRSRSSPPGCARPGLISASPRFTLVTDHVPDVLASDHRARPGTNLDHHLGASRRLPTPSPDPWSWCSRAMHPLPRVIAVSVLV